MYACAEGNCQRHGRDDCSVRRQDPADESGRQANRQAGGTGVEVVHPLERGLVMDGVQECQTPSKRLKAILSVPKWQKQMTEIEVGSNCYELPDTNAFQVVQPFRWLRKTRLCDCLAASLSADRSLQLETHRTLPAKEKPRRGQH